MNSTQRIFATLATLLIAAACGPPPPAPIPSLTPLQAQELLNQDRKAQNWMKFITSQGGSCQYSIDLPDQSGHPSTIDINHVVTCGGRPAPKMFDATVSFAYDKAAGRWVITRFMS
ncbi:MAG TPA: hypothetical protein VH325_02675 [Bryobacteraceae bacterium]|nr:hypothetical protein [Bryobacteraceae bacterium]